MCGNYRILNETETFRIRRKPIHAITPYGTSFKTLHLFLKIKVLRRPVEATVQTCRSWVDLVLQLSIPKPDFDAELQRFNILGGDFAGLS